MLSPVVVAARRAPIATSSKIAGVLGNGRQGIHMTSFMNGAKGEIYKTEPVKFQLEKGKTYKWCACGLSCKQPFCDGSHKDSKQGLKFIEFTPDVNKEYFLCNCKQTNKRPFCDGTHKNH